MIAKKHQMTNQNESCGSNSDDIFFADPGSGSSKSSDSAHIGSSGTESNKPNMPVIDEDTPECIRWDLVIRSITLEVQHYMLHRYKWIRCIIYNMCSFFSFILNMI